MIRAGVVAVLVAGVLAVAPQTSAARASAAPGQEGTTYTPVTPTRVLDTRAGAPVGPGGTVTLDLTGQVPAGARAVVLNVTGVSPTAATYVTAYPGGARPAVSSVNLRAGETRANHVTVAVSGGRTVDLYNHAGRTHLVADLAGYYRPGDGSRYTPLEATRVTATHLGPNGTATVDLAGRVPESATAVVLTVTGTRGSADTYLTAYPAGTQRPTASTVNLRAGATNPNQATVALGDGRRVQVHNHAGDLDVLVDLAGFYSPGFGAAFVPVAPARVFDTRTGVGTDFGQGTVGPGHSDGFVPEVPADAVAVAVNLTGIEPSAATYVSAWSSTTLPPPGTSTLNLAAGQTAANHAVVPLVGARSAIYNHAGQVHVAADLAGYFTVPGVDCVRGCVYAWGRDGGTLGTGWTATATPSPRLVGLTDVVDVDDGYAVRADGTVWAWGSNYHAELGNGWASGLTPITTPVQVLGLTGVVQVASAGNAGLALRGDGTVWGWGTNRSGILGTGGGTDPTAPPVRIAGLSDITALAAAPGVGYAVRADGTLWAWGYNGVGQLGDGSTVTESPTPVRVGELTGVTAVDAEGATTYAHTADGATLAWGGNDEGQLGDGSDVRFSRVPVRFTRVQDAVDVSVDLWGRGFAVRADGTVWGWGTNREGELGTGEDCAPTDTAPECFAEAPVRVAGLTGVVDVELTALGGRALDADGRVWGWGGNRDGDLGGGTTGGYSTVPVPVAGIGVANELGGGGALVEVAGA